MVDRRCFTLLLVGFVICDLFVVNVIGVDTEQKKKSEKKSKKGFYFSAQCGFGCGKNNEAMEPVPLSQIRSSPSTPSALSRASLLKVSEKDKNLLFPLPRPSKPLPEPQLPSSSHLTQTHKQFAQTSANPNSMPSNFKQESSLPSSASIAVPRKQFTETSPNPGSSAFKQVESQPFAKGSGQQLPPQRSALPLPPLPPLPPSANAKKSHKIAPSRFKDPSSLVSQRVQQVEDRIKMNINPLLVPVPLNPPKNNLGRPKPNHFDVPRVPDENGQIL
ncbi:uncharacterized protein C6orf132 homolog [Contarinia nasturtii]|uniref:uncharacterized protein C6orf132 homolog n=1 Tax=Contarinia nasturtii TaxID=265458 RepID=UPI0012D415DC|nr:uncharacterized protein C6orf132 homolog [Contarinia nasturtii]